MANPEPRSPEGLTLVRPHPGLESLGGGQAPAAKVNNHGSRMAGPCYHHSFSCISCNLGCFLPDVVIVHLVLFHPRNLQDRESLVTQ